MILRNLILSALLGPIGIKRNQTVFTNAPQILSLWISGENSHAFTERSDDDDTHKKHTQKKHFLTLTEKERKKKTV